MQTITLPAGGDITTILQKAPPYQGLHIPGGNYTLSEPVALDGISVSGDGTDTRIRYVGPAAPGTPAIDITDTRGLDLMPVLRGFCLTGPGGTDLGVKTSHVDGIRYSTKGRLYNVSANSFDAGVVFNSLTGHIYLTDCNLNSNFYGLYLAQNTGGPALDGCLLVNSRMAGIGAPAGGGMNAAVFRSCHFGLCPYVLYQEAPTPDMTGWDGGLMIEVAFERCGFEDIGNGLFVSDVIGVDGGKGRSIVNAVTIEWPGFSWDNAFRLPDRNRDYAIALDCLNGVGIKIINGYNNLSPGDKGLFAVNKIYTNITIDGVPQSLANGHGGSLLPTPAAPTAPVAVDPD